MLTLRSKILLSALVLILFFGLTNLWASSSNGSKWGQVTFATHRNALKFFDQVNGRVYVYDEETGKVRTIWQVQALGSDLTRVYDWQGRK